MHSFAVPILGHERGFSATTIGLVLGVFTLSVTAVRLVIPFLAHRIDEALVLRVAMVWTGLVLALYPFAQVPWVMACFAALLGLSLGAVQPMIMATLHRLTPENRHGEAIAFRSMAINAASSLMPLLFGVVGVAAGPALLFWSMATAVAGGSRLVRRLR